MFPYNVNIIWLLNILALTVPDLMNVIPETRHSLFGFDLSFKFLLTDLHQVINIRCKQIVNNATQNTTKNGVRLHGGMHGMICVYRIWRKDKCEMV